MFFEGAAGSLEMSFSQEYREQFDQREQAARLDARIVDCFFGELALAVFERALVVLPPPFERGGQDAFPILHWEPFGLSSGSSSAAGRGARRTSRRLDLARALRGTNCVS